VGIFLSAFRVTPPSATFFETTGKRDVHSSDLVSNKDEINAVV